MVVNTSPSIIKNGHFIGILRKEKDQILFFDPLNLEYNCFINEFLKKTFV